MQYPFTTLIPNLGVWLPPESDYSDKGSSGGSGSDGLVLCVSLIKETKRFIFFDIGFGNCFFV